MSLNKFLFEKGILIKTLGGTRQTLQDDVTWYFYVLIVIGDDVVQADDLVVRVVDHSAAGGH